MIALIYPALWEVLIRGREVTQSKAEAVPQGLPWPHSSRLVSGEPHAGLPWLPCPLSLAAWGKAAFPCPAPSQEMVLAGEAAGLEPA